MEIQAAIQRSQYIIIVLSPHSIISEWVEREFIYASNHNLKVIPLIHKTCDLPLWSVTMHYIDMQGRNYQRHFGELLRVLGMEPGLEMKAAIREEAATWQAAEESSRREEQARQQSITEGKSRLEAEEHLQQETEIQARQAAREQEQSRREMQKREQRAAEMVRLQQEIELALVGEQWGKARLLISQLKQLGPEGRTLAEGLRKRLPIIRTPGWAWAVPAVLVLIALLGFWVRGYLGSARPAPSPTPSATVTQMPNSMLTITSTFTLPFTPTATYPLLFTATPSTTATPAYAIGSTWTRPSDDMLMVYVPEGNFSMGSDNGAPDEQPVHTVYLDAYWIDKTEVINAMYAQCVQAGACGAPTSSQSHSHSSYFGNARYDNYPVIYMNWDDAQSYCKWVRVRLPTEAEWEKAARGSDGRIYPWGNSIPSSSRANFASPDTTAVGSYPSGASPYGALDMAGNVWEWMNDWFDASYYPGPSSNPQGAGPRSTRVIRGGSWADSVSSLRSALRGRADPSYSGDHFGFRCASNLITSSSPTLTLVPSPTFTATATSNSPTGTITGSIMWDDIPFTGVTVKLCTKWLYTCSGTEFTGVTDAKGVFTIAEISPGDYQVITKYPGQNDETRMQDQNAGGAPVVVKVSAGEMFNLDRVDICKVDLVLFAPIMTSNSVAFSWQAVPGVTRYAIGFTGPGMNGGNDTVHSTSYTEGFDVGHSHGSYQWNVISRDAPCHEGFGNFTIP